MFKVIFALDVYLPRNPVTGEKYDGSYRPYLAIETEQTLPFKPSPGESFRVAGYDFHATECEWNLERQAFVLTERADHDGKQGDAESPNIFAGHWLLMMLERGWRFYPHTYCENFGSLKEAMECAHGEPVIQVGDAFFCGESFYSLLLYKSGILHAVYTADKE